MKPSFQSAKLRFIVLLLFLATMPVPFAVAETVSDDVSRATPPSEPIKETAQLDYILSIEIEKAQQARDSADKNLKEAQEKLNSTKSRFEAIQKECTGKIATLKEAITAAKKEADSCSVRKREKEREVSSIWEQCKQFKGRKDYQSEARCKNQARTVEAAAKDLGKICNADYTKETSLKDQQKQYENQCEIQKRDFKLTLQGLQLILDKAKKTFQGASNDLTELQKASKKASECVVMIDKEPDNPNLASCVAAVLASKVVVVESALLRAVSSRWSEANSGPLCQVIKTDFDQAHPNIINVAELNLRDRLSCADNAQWLLGELQKGTNEFVTMLIPFHLASTEDAGAVKGAVDYFRHHSEKLTLVNLDQLSYALFAVKECDLMDRLVDEEAKRLMGLQHFLPNNFLEGWADNPDLDSIAQHYVQCKGYQPGKAEMLISLLRGSPKDWPFPTKVGKVSFRIQEQAITALEMQLAHKQITPQQEGLQEAMMEQMQNGHPQVVPDAMHFLKKYYSSPEIDAQIMQVAMKPNAKKYWQSHAIMVFMKSGQRDEALQIARASQYKQIRGIGELIEGTK